MLGKYAWLVFEVLNLQSFSVILSTTKAKCRDCDVVDSIKMEKRYYSVNK